MSRERKICPRCGKGRAMYYLRNPKTGAWAWYHAACERAQAKDWRRETLTGKEVSK